MNKRETAYTEYIEYMGAYRVYMESTPQNTIAYDDDLEEVRRWAEDNNYNLIITA